MNHMHQNLINIGIASFTIFFGYFCALQLSKISFRLMNTHVSAHVALISKQISFYSIFLLFLLFALNQLGLNISVFLGAAGVFTIAFSFASQTAASNLMSGIFLLFEQPFKIEDHIEVKGLTGKVIAIDLLSTKLQTRDNKLVRIPNETIIKSEITNLNYFPIRSTDILLMIHPEQNLKAVKAQVLDIVQSFPQILKDPPPKISIHNVSDQGTELKIQIWAETSGLSSAKSAILEKINIAMGQLENEAVVV